MNIGDDSVVIGNVGDSGNVGNRSVRIGATDANGNTILRPDAGGMAIGYGAKAGPYSIAIGTNAGGGSELFLLLDQLRLIAKESNDENTVQKISELVLEKRKTNPDQNIIFTLWNTITATASISGAIDLVTKISRLI